MSPESARHRAPRNKTIVLSDEERHRFRGQLVTLSGKTTLAAIENKIINQDLFEILDCLPESFVDLAVIDPPYNLTKSFNSSTFRRRSTGDYQAWLETWLPRLIATLKPTASLYICGEWRSSSAIHRVAERYFTVRNRITWERDKGRGASTNWKNCSEDIWFCTVSGTYTFNLDAVKLNRRVIAPYKDLEGNPRDWTERPDGRRFRLTHPSNLWTDLTVPFWSMPENTDHPAQKSEKLLAKLIFASSDPGDLVFDPFMGSGTSAVVAKKLGRRYVGIEVDTEYCLVALKRLERAQEDKSIQGYSGGVFWERNSFQSEGGASRALPGGGLALFPRDEAKDA